MWGIRCVWCLRMLWYVTGWDFVVVSILLRIFYELFMTLIPLLHWIFWWRIKYYSLLFSDFYEMWHPEYEFNSDNIWNFFLCWDFGVLHSTTSYPAGISIKNWFIKVSGYTMITTCSFALFLEPFGLPLDLLGKVVVISSEFWGRLINPPCDGALGGDVGITNFSVLMFVVMLGREIVCPIISPTVTEEPQEGVENLKYLFFENSFLEFEEKRGQINSLPLLENIMMEE